jgi:hypothetical protein
VSYLEAVGMQWASVGVVHEFRAWAVKNPLEAPRERVAARRDGGLDRE